MIEYRKVRDPRAEKLDEARDSRIQNGADGIERVEGLLDYVAMMTDVELPEEDTDE